MDMDVSYREVLEHAVRDAIAIGNFARARVKRMRVTFSRDFPSEDVGISCKVACEAQNSHRFRASSIVIIATKSSRTTCSTGERLQLLL